MAFASFLKIIFNIWETYSLDNFYNLDLNNIQMKPRLNWNQAHQYCPFVCEKGTRLPPRIQRFLLSPCCSWLGLLFVKGRAENFFRWELDSSPFILCIKISDLERLATVCLVIFLRVQWYSKSSLISEYLKTCWRRKTLEQSVTLRHSAFPFVLLYQVSRLCRENSGLPDSKLNKYI